jgi:signal transduction histidine kinase
VTTPQPAGTDTLGGVKPLEATRARLRAMDPFRVDVALAAVFIAAGVIELALIDSEGHSRGLTLAAGVVALSSIAFRRRNGMLTAALFVVPVFTQMLAGGYLTTNTTTPFVAVLLLLFSVSRYAPGRRIPAALALLVVGTTVTIFLEDGFEPDELFWAVFLFGLPVLAGRALRSRALLQAELREKAEQAERDRVMQARGAVEDERVRIAAELQALVANGLSAMVVQAELVPRALAAGDGPRAGAALAAVEEAGRDALTEMRRLLGVLRRDGDGAELAPQPGLPRVLALVQRTRKGGLPVELRIEGRDKRRGRLPPGVDLTGYRVIEDALEAAAEQGATAAELLIRYTGEELRIQVTDDREGGASDRLPGLRDRVGLYGGHLSAGPLDKGGFRLRARLPTEVVS